MQKETFFPHRVSVIVIPIVLFIAIILVPVLIIVFYLPLDFDWKLMFVPVLIILSFPFIALILGIFESLKKIRIHGDTVLVRGSFRTVVIQKDRIEKVLLNHQMGSSIRQYSLWDKPMPIVKGLMFRFVLKTGEEYPLRIKNQSGTGWALIGDSNSVYEKAIDFFKRNGIAVEVTSPVRYKH